MTKGTKIVSLNTFQNLSRAIYYNNRSKKNKLKPIQKIPNIWYLTDNIKTKKPSLTLNNLPKNSGVVIRPYDPKQKYKNIKNLIKISRKNSLTILIAGKKAFPFTNGSHIPRWIFKSPKNNKIVSISVHGLKDMRRTINSKANLAFISPVFQTTSHLHKDLLGVVKLGLISRKFKIPLIALGGINEKNIKSLRSIPIHGCAGIDVFEKNN